MSGSAVWTNLTKLQLNAAKDDKIRALIAHRVGRVAHILFLLQLDYKKARQGMIEGSGHTNADITQQEKATTRYSLYRHCNNF